MTPDDPAFAAFWRAYPRKVGRADAWKAWQQTRASRPTLEALQAAVVAYCAWRARLESQRQFVPPLLYPASWLRQERWADEFDTGAPVQAAPAVDPAEQERRELERMLTMRARAAWSDVRSSLEFKSVPLGGWPDPRTLPSLEAIGGFGRICRCTTRQELNALALEFEAAYLAGSSAGEPAACAPVQRGSSLDP